MGTFVFKTAQNFGHRIKWQKCVASEIYIPPLGLISCVRYFCHQSEKQRLETEETVCYPNRLSHPTTHSPVQFESNKWTCAAILTENDRGSSQSLVSKENDLLVTSYFPPTFNFSAYINKSPTLQQLVKLGVDLHKLEKMKGIPQFILKLDFDRDMKPYVRFLHEIGVDADELGEFFTRNPLIFKEDLDDLTVRLNYLQSKKFSKPMVVKVVSNNPYWLMFSTQRIDRRLGYFQRTFALRGKEVRSLAVKQPRLITYNMNHIKINTFVIKEELGFTEEEMKKLLLQKPKLWMINQVSLKRRFDYVHNVMKISHEQLLKHPEILGSREFRTKQRHLFLESLDRAQYDPTAEGYVPLNKLVSGTDIEFCQNIAKTSVGTFNAFLKTL
ncbi:transcription termination factor 3, mitochondrial [Anabrus simplex]|uniref:transcription termination factor 3, mitochondrial n=1 Tax=Anabrus simplex TaxID=316456 RepID=UPI0035A2A7DC